MVINMQAFNACGVDNRRIYEELDDFQSRRPIDVIASNRPILILDEPQKIKGEATREALPKFNPLFILRYSATHSTEHNRVHRLDALDAYNQKLVKKITVRGIQTRGLAGTNAYLYLEGIDISKKALLIQIVRCSPGGWSLPAISGCTSPRSKTAILATSYGSFPKLSPALPHFTGNACWQIVLVEAESCTLALLWYVHPSHI